MEEEAMKKIELLIELLMTQKQLFNIKELSLYTNISVSELYKLTSDRKIPHFKRPGGKLLFFDRVEIDNWIKEFPVKTRGQIDNDANKRIQTQ